MGEVIYIIIVFSLGFWLGWDFGQDSQKRRFYNHLYNKRYLK